MVCFPPDNSRLLLAVSGGIDSMVMLDILHNAAKERGYSLSVVTVDHMIRNEGASDAMFVFERCKAYGIMCEIVTVDVPNYALNHKLSVETAARILRKEALQGRADGALICLAHNKNDLVETVIMHIARGSGIHGASGMRVCEGNLFRPILRMSRRDIEGYAASHNIRYVNDATNDDSVYRRNYVRHEVIPVLRQLNPDIENAIQAFARRCMTDDDFIVGEAQRIPIEVKDGEARVSVSDMDIDEAVRIRVIKRALHEIGCDVDVEDVHFKAINGLVGSESGRVIQLVHGYRVMREFDKLRFYAEQAQRNTEEIPFNRFDIADAYRFDGYRRLKADAKRLEGATVRCRRQGDVIDKFGGGRVKLKDYLIEKRVPLSMRDKLTLIVKGNEVLAILGVEISSAVKVTENTQSIVEL